MVLCPQQQRWWHWRHPVSHMLGIWCLIDPQHGPLIWHWVILHGADTCVPLGSIMVPPQLHSPLQLLSSSRQRVCCRRRQQLWWGWIGGGGGEDGEVIYPQVLVVSMAYRVLMDNRCRSHYNRMGMMTTTTMQRILLCHKSNSLQEATVMA